MNDFQISTYPDPAVESLDSRFDDYKLGNAAVERLWTGARWAEGPVWFGDHHCLLFSDIPNDRMLRWDEATGAISVFRNPAHFQQRQHARPPGATRHVRAPGAPRYAYRARRADHGAGGRLRGQAAQRT